MLNFTSNDQFELVDEKAEGIIFRVRVPFGAQSAPHHWLNGEEFRHNDKVFAIAELVHDPEREGMLIGFGQLSYREVMRTQLIERLTQKGVGDDARTAATEIYDMLFEQIESRDQVGMMKAESMLAEHLQGAGRGMRKAIRSR